jgi:hypothetical protein
MKERVYKMMKTDKTAVFWYFQSGNSSSDESNTEWVKYRDIEIEIIEDVYQEGKTEVFLDAYRIDLKKFIQVSESDPTQQCHVRRDMDCRLEENLREERFCSELVLASPQSYGSVQAWCTFLITWLDSTAGKRALVDFFSAIDSCADGILEEAIKSNSNSITEAKWMAKLLHSCKTKSRQEVTKTCIHLYTRESFLYRILNTALRNNDHSKIATLGPLCYLIQDFTRTFKGFIGTVYRGLSLSSEQILTYKQAVGSWHTWPSFTSTSKNRKMAEIRGNTLVIITVAKYNHSNFVRGLEIAEMSHFPNEEEVLLPAGVIFQIISVKKYSSQKYIIEINM